MLWLVHAFHSPGGRGKEERPLCSIKLTGIGTVPASWFAAVVAVTSQLRIVFSFASCATMFCKDSSDSERSGSAVRRRSRHHGVSVQNGPIVLGFSAFRRARRMRHQKRMTKEEYHRLKHMVPSVSSQARVSKVRSDYSHVNERPVRTFLFLFGGRARHPRHAARLFACAVCYVLRQPLTRFVRMRFRQQVQVIEEAIKYIDSLHMALFQRLKAQEIAADDGASHPSDAAGECERFTLLSVLLKT